VNNVNVCLGDEWYRFPSHYFLHDKARLLWVESGPKGLLPKYYASDKEAPSASSTNRLLDFIQQRLGTYLSADGFNSKNHEDKSRYSVSLAI
jgi:alpha-1,2-mannosyltransferase